MLLTDISAIVGGEESQAVTIELRALGVEAYSCDFKACSGGHPEWHIQGDMVEAVARRKWTYGVFHPTCTRITNSGVLRLYKDGKKANGIDPVKWQEMVEASLFFKQVLEFDIPFMRVENPIPHGHALAIIGEKYKQIVQPYHFLEDASKATAFWLKNLPLLKHTGYYPPRIVDGRKRWGNQTDSGQNKLAPDSKSNPGRRAELRSKTYPGMAQAIAQQDIYHILNYQKPTLF